MPVSVTVPSDNGAPRWQQRSSSAATSPRPFRNRNTGSLRSVRAKGLSASSVAVAATYHAFRTNMCSLLTTDAPPPLRKNTTACPRSSEPGAIGQSLPGCDVPLISQERRNLLLFFTSRAKMACGDIEAEQLLFHLE